MGKTCCGCLHCRRAGPAASHAVHCHCCCRSLPAAAAPYRSSSAAPSCPHPHPGLPTDPGHTRNHNTHARGPLIVTLPSLRPLCQALMREHMRTSDRALSNIEGMPEGFNALRRLHEQIQVRQRSPAYPGLH